MQLKPALASAKAHLTVHQVPSPRMNAELLLMFVLNRDRAYLYAHPERELTPEEADRYETALAERTRGVPAQYITGHQEFWGMDLIVSPAVLIPRPETEHVVEAVLNLIPGHGCPTSGASPQTSAEPRSPVPGARSPGSEVQGLRSKIRILDVGTGSGCIALALAKELPEAEIHASDDSPAALEIARANAARHQLGDRISFRQADLLAGAEPNSFDFIVSNPPYVGESEADQVQLEVRKFEPRHAVFAGRTGVEVIARLIPQSYSVLRPGGWLVMEISGAIARRIDEMLKAWREVELHSDLQAIPRVVRARKPPAISPPGDPNRHSPPSPQRRG